MIMPHGFVQKVSPRWYSRHVRIEERRYHVPFSLWEQVTGSSRDISRHFESTNVVYDTGTRHRCDSPRFISTRRLSIISNRGINHYPGRQCRRKWRRQSATEATKVEWRRFRMFRAPAWGERNASTFISNTCYLTNRFRGTPSESLFPSASFLGLTNIGFNNKSIRINSWRCVKLLAGMRILRTSLKIIEPWENFRFIYYILDMFGCFIYIFVQTYKIRILGISSNFWEIRGFSNLQSVSCNMRIYIKY